MGGPVHEILVAPGQTVTAGTPLLTVNSPDYSVARSAYIKAKDALLLADKAYTRAQDLYQHGAIAESDPCKPRSLHAIKPKRTWSPAGTRCTHSESRILILF